MRIDTRELIEQHAKPLRPGRYLQPQQLLNCQGVAEIVSKRAEIIDSVSQWHNLLIKLGLAGFFYAGVQISDVRHDAHHVLAVDLENDSQHSVGRRMLRPHIQDHGAVLAGVERGRGSKMRHGDYR